MKVPEITQFTFLWGVLTSRCSYVLSFILSSVRDGVRMSSVTQTYKALSKISLDGHTYCKGGCCSKAFVFTAVTMVQYITRLSLLTGKPQITLR